MVSSHGQAILASSVNGILQQCDVVLDTYQVLSKCRTDLNSSIPSCLELLVSVYSPSAQLWIIEDLQIQLHLFWINPALD